MTGPNAHGIARVGALACFATAFVGIVAAYPDAFGRPSYQSAAFPLFDEAVFTAQFPLLVVILLGIRSLHVGPHRSWGRLGATGFFLTLAGCSLITLKEVLILLDATAGLPLTQAVVTILMATGSILVVVGLPLVAGAVLRARTIPLAQLLILLGTVVAAVVASAVLGRAAATVAVSAMWCCLAIVLWRTREPTEVGRSAQREVLAS